MKKTRRKGKTLEERRLRQIIERTLERREKLKAEQELRELGLLREEVNNLHAQYETTRHERDIARSVIRDIKDQMGDIKRRLWNMQELAKVVGEQVSKARQLMAIACGEQE